jgi:aryl-alcohol dehydrogenase-like predicted oxidoreductase
MRRLRQEGLVAEVGVSDYDLDRWQAAERHLGSPVLVNQALYSLLRRDAEETILPWAAAHGRLVVVAQPLATGLLSGAYHGGKRVSGAWRSGSRVYSSGNLESTKELIEIAGEVAKVHDATVAQVALAYVLRHENVVTIPGAATASQLAENVAAADLVLSDDESQALADAAKRCEELGIKERQSGLPARVLRARDRLGWAKHWGRGVRLVAATALEDRRHRRAP